MPAPENIDDYQLILGQPWENLMIVALVLMMFSVALSLRPTHFKLIGQQPKSYFAGLFLQIVGLPLLTLLLCFIFNPLPSLALGMILVACCPGGNVSNLLATLAKGNIALSVSLTTTSSLLAAFITPISIVFWTSFYPPTSNVLNAIEFNSVTFLFQTSMLLILPLFLGMLLIFYYPNVAQRIQQPLILLSTTLLLMVILVAFTHYFDYFITVGIGVIVLLILHNASAFFIGYLGSKAINATNQDRISLSFEIGIQNSGLAIVILLTQLNGLGGAATAVGFWGIWHIIAGILLVALFRYKKYSEVDHV